MPRPFGRSLDPLPEEDIGGFLLRLSTHLDMPPVTVARHLGLVNETQPTISRRILIHSELDEFARLARLTAGEARALTLLDLEERYQPIETARALTHPRRPTISTPSWSYSGTLRHCPSCLAGDGSAIQTVYGGAWRRLWRLPIAFACVEHRCFLAEGCGAEHAARLGSPPLIPITAASGLHPAQCRHPRPHQHGRNSKPCGNRLDHSLDDITPRPSPAHLDAQQRILRHLDPDNDPRHARRFFADLRLVAASLNVLPAAHWAEIGAETHEAIAETISRYTEPAHTTTDRAPRDVISTAMTLATAVAIRDSAVCQERLRWLLFQTIPVEQRYRLRALEKIGTRYADTCTPELYATLHGGTPGS